MYEKKQSIHYCTILSTEQWNFLLDGKFSTHRQKCLYKLMTNAVQAKTAYKIKGIEFVLEVGEVAASDVELAEHLGCNRKTIGKLIDSFNRLGMLTTRTNNRTSIHTLHFLTGWYVGGVLMTNPHYVRPSTTPKEQADDVRTPRSNDLLPEDKQSTVQSKVYDTKDSRESGTVVFSPSLCSSAINKQLADNHLSLPDRFSVGKTGNSHIIDGRERISDDNSEESSKETQDGTIDGEDSPNTGKRD